MMESSRKQLRILLVEDNPTNQQVVTLFLSHDGHSVTIAESGGESLALVERERFDVILMDVQMPDMDGYLTTREIRLRERETGERVPIIALTAHAFEADRARCFEAGMDEFLTKPINMNELRRILDRIICAGDTNHDPGASHDVGHRAA